MTDKKANSFLSDTAFIQIDALILTTDALMGNSLILTKLAKSITKKKKTKQKKKTFEFIDLVLFPKWLQLLFKIGWFCVGVGRGRGGFDRNIEEK